MLPPKTIRYCLNCEKTTEFKYNKTIGHSRCIECDGYKCFNIDKHLSEYLENIITKRLCDIFLDKCNKIILKELQNNFTLSDDVDISINNIKIEIEKIIEKIKYKK